MGRRGDGIYRHGWRIVPTLIAACVALAPLPARAQAVDEYFLNSTASISHAWDGGSFATGFFMLHEVSREPGTDRVNYKVLLVTNKHALPSEPPKYDGNERAI